MKLSEESIMRVLPGALKNGNLGALASATADELARQAEEIKKIRIYTNTDELPESLLDILARDFNVTWWDPDAPLEQKRRTFSAAQEANRIAGTVEALKKQVSAVYPGAQLEEWFEYGGEPGHFRISGVPTMDEQQHTEALKMIERVKRESAVLDAVTMLSEHEMRARACTARVVNRVITVACERPE